MSMVTKLFIFMLLLQVSNAGQTYNNLTNYFQIEKSYFSNNNNFTVVQLAEIFKKSCLEPGGVLLSKSRICIPAEHEWLSQYPPTTTTVWFWKLFSSPVNMTIEIYNIQVVEIDVHLVVTWEDNRPVLFTLTSLEVIYLGMDDEKEIWSPKIGIRSNMVSKNIQGKEIGLARPWLWRYGANITNSFYLTTKVKCEMDFQTFPFDNHVCNLEVIIFFKKNSQFI